VRTQVTVPADQKKKRRLLEEERRIIIGSNFKDSTCLLGGEQEKENVCTDPSASRKPSVKDYQVPKNKKHNRIQS
jgi:hypothetical protein